MTLKAVDKIVETLLSVFKVTSIPINVEEIAKLRGLNVVPYPLESGVSGILLIEGEQGTIGYDEKESIVRRRFTIAHELGHFELHRSLNHLFVDKNFKVLFRSAKQSPKSPDAIFEQEANAFAAALLMPASFIESEIENKSIDLGTDGVIKELASQFEVSEAAMYYRLLNLGHL